MSALEAHYRVRLPADFRDYLLVAAPASGSEMDANDSCWWPVSRIASITDEYPHEIHDPAIAREAETCLFFADHMIWAAAWAIACGDGPNHGRIAIVGYGDRFVAEDFASFVARYVEGDRSLF